MADTADNNSGNDLEAQLEALMKQAREGNTADEAQAAEEPAVVTTEPEPEAAEEEPADLASQLDALMAKAGQENDEPLPAAEAASAPDTPPSPEVIADGPADVEDAFDDLQGAFDAVQDVIAELADEDTDDTSPEPEPENAVATEPELPAAATPVATEPEPQADTEQDQDGDDLAAQLQSLLDEASSEEADSFVSPDELVNESAEAEDDELDGDHATVDDVIAQATSEASTPPEAEPPQETTAPAELAPEAQEPQAPAEDQPLIEQIDSLLADHAEEAISGEFESVDELLGVDSAAGENPADPADDLDEEQEDDGLGGDFQSMEDLLAKPDEEEPEPVDQGPTSAATSGREEPAVELDQLDGLFAAPTPIVPSPHADAPAAPSAENDETGDAGGFESLDELLTAPPPTEDERDGAPPTAEQAGVAEAASTSKSDAKNWKFTIDLGTFRAAVAFLLGWSLWICAMVNKPLGKLPEDIQQAIGWAALALAGPGLLLIVYGLLLN